MPLSSSRSAARLATAIGHCCALPIRPRHLRDLLAIRDPLYREIADLVVETDERPPRMVVLDILERLAAVAAPLKRRTKCAILGVLPLTAEVVANGHRAASHQLVAVDIR